jgi:hypothetical protein
MTEFQNEVLMWGIWIALGLYSFLLLWILTRPRLPCLPDTQFDIEAPVVTVVIAARNEAGNIRRTLDSLLNQDAVVHVIVVDDHSTDRTREVVAGVAQHDPRVKIVSAPSVPTGWVGKSFALDHGQELADTPLILFTDADVIFSPGVIRNAAAYMEGNQLDHLSGHFFIQCRSVWEKICAPVLALSSRLALFGSAQRSGAATGAFNMVRVAAYRRFKGHYPIRSEIVDDVALARHMKAAGAKNAFLYFGDQLKVRLFVGLSGFIDAVSRSSVSFTKMPPAIVVLLTSIPFLLSLVTVGGVFVFGEMLLGLDKQQMISNPGSSLLLLPYILGLIIMWMGAPFTDSHWFYRIFYPVAGIVLVIGVCRSAVMQMTGRSVEWRGRRYAIS